MKKNLLFLALVLCIGFLSSVQAQRAIKNGFSINAVIGVPSGSFGIESLNSDLQINMLYGLQLGNRWYFNSTEQYGIGLMVNWIDFTIGVNINYDYAVVAALDLTFLEVGPIGTFAISEDMAIDGYYNLRPTVFSWAIESEDYDLYASAGFGYSHAIGTAFRYKVLNIGVEYVLGSIKVSQEESSGNNIPNNGKMITNSFRILIGAKF